MFENEKHTHTQTNQTQFKNNKNNILFLLNKHYMCLQ